VASFKRIPNTEKRKKVVKTSKILLLVIRPLPGFIKKWVGSVSKNPIIFSTVPDKKE
jgi:hypothetical protein